MGLFGIFAILLGVGAMASDTNKTAIRTYDSYKEAVKKGNITYVDGNMQTRFTKTKELVRFETIDGRRCLVNRLGMEIYDIVNGDINKLEEQYGDEKVMLTHACYFDFLSRVIREKWESLILVEKETWRPAELVVYHGEGDDCYYCLEFLKKADLGGNVVIAGLDERREISKEEYERYYNLLGKYKIRNFNWSSYYGAQYINAIKEWRKNGR